MRTGNQDFSLECFIFLTFTMETELENAGRLTEMRLFHYNSECIQNNEQLHAWQVGREIMTKIEVVMFRLFFWWFIWYECKSEHCRRK